jgi:hypothetical protein
MRRSFRPRSLLSLAPVPPLGGWSAKGAAQATTPKWAYGRAFGVRAGLKVIVLVNILLRLLPFHTPLCPAGHLPLKGGD